MEPDESMARAFTKGMIQDGEIPRGRYPDLDRELGYTSSGTYFTKIKSEDLEEDLKAMEYQHCEETMKTSKPETIEYKKAQLKKRNLLQEKERINKTLKREKEYLQLELNEARRKLMNYENQRTNKQIENIKALTIILGTIGVFLIIALIVYLIKSK